MQITKIHHVAYRCKDAKETVEWYVKHLNMKFLLAIAEDQVPSTHAPDPYMHLFMDAGQGNVLAFFEIPNSPCYCVRVLWLHRCILLKNASSVHL